MKAEDSIRTLTEEEMSAVSGGILLLYWLLLRDAH